MNNIVAIMEFLFGLLLIQLIDSVIQNMVYSFVKGLRLCILK